MKLSLRLLLNSAARLALLLALLLGSAYGQESGTTEGSSDNSAAKSGKSKKPPAEGANVADDTKKSEEKPAEEPESDGKNSTNSEPPIGPQPAKGEANGAEGKAKPKSDGSMFNREDILGGLPDRYKDEPGFIPDRSPEDLFHRPEGQTPRERYKSLLGESMLPEGRVRDIIGIETGDPSRDVPQNFARIVVPDGTIEGSSENKQFKIRGGVIIFYNDVQITAEEADIDEKHEVAVLRDAVEVVDPHYDLKTDDLRIYFKEKKFEGSGFVQFTKHAKEGASQPNLSLPKKDRLREYFSAQSFELYGNQLHYDWGTKELSAVGSVRIVHPSFSGTMERLDYNDKAKQYGMHGGVQLNVTDYSWIFTNQLTDPSDEKKVRAVTDQPTLITADKVLYSDETAVAQFYAQQSQQVHFDQTKRKIDASYMEINDKTKDFYAEGIEGSPAMFSQTDGDWLLAAGVINPDQADQKLRDTLAKPMTAKARTITYNYDRKRLEMKDGVEIRGETQSLTAGEMIQDETAKYFLLRNNVVIQPDADTQIVAAQVYVDTASDVYTFIGLVEGRGKNEDLAGVAGEQEAGANGMGGEGAVVTGQPGIFQEQPASGTINTP